LHRYQVSSIKVQTDTDEDDKGCRRGTSKARKRQGPCRLEEEEEEKEVVVVVGDQWVRRRRGLMKDLDLPSTKPAAFSLLHCLLITRVKHPGNPYILSWTRSRVAMPSSDALSLAISLLNFPRNMRRVKPSPSGAGAVKSSRASSAL